MTTATKDTLFKAGKWMSLVGFIYLVQYYTDSNISILFTESPAYFLLVLAGIANAVSDTVAHHYGTSIFNKLNPQWWDATKSWQNKHKYFLFVLGYRIPIIPVSITDSWHLFKTIQSTCLILSIPVYYLTAHDFELSTKGVAIEFIKLMAAYKLSFTICYSYYFKRFQK